jgi:hypothetical protein
VIDCNEWKTEERHDCTNMGKVKRLELWWQLYVTWLPVRDLENFRPLDFCWTEGTSLKKFTIKFTIRSRIKMARFVDANSLPAIYVLSTWEAAGCISSKQAQDGRTVAGIWRLSKRHWHALSLRQRSSQIHWTLRKHFMKHTVPFYDTYGAILWNPTSFMLYTFFSQEHLCRKMHLVT